MTPQEEQDQLDQIFGPVEDVTPSITGVIDQNPPPGEQSLDEIFGFDAKTPDTPLEGATSAWDEYWKPKQKSVGRCWRGCPICPPSRPSFGSCTGGSGSRGTSRHSVHEKGSSRAPCRRSGPSESSPCHYPL